jgi:hypothetical protein
MGLQHHAFARADDAYGRGRPPRRETNTTIVNDINPGIRVITMYIAKASLSPNACFFTPPVKSGRAAARS